MFFKNIKIKNYKCFVDLNNGKGLSLNIPNEKPGGGLNIFIGNNNSGKTTVLGIFQKLDSKESKILEEEKNRGNNVFIEFCASETREDTEDYIYTIENHDQGAHIKNLPGNDDFPIKFNDMEIIKDNRIWTSTSANEWDVNAYRGNKSFKRQDIDGFFANRLSALDSKEENKKEKMNEYIKKLYQVFRIGL